MLRMSDQIDQLATAMSVALAEFPAIPKDSKAEIPTRTGGKYTYNYAELSAVIQITTPILSKHGLVVSQDPGIELIGTKEQTGIWTTIMHKSGQYKSAFFPIHRFDKAQEQGSEITYKRRYTLNGALGIHPEDDDDGKSATEGKPKSASAQQASPPPQQRPTNPPAQKKESPALTAMNSSQWVIPFGTKYKGKTMGEVPFKELTNYHKWLKGQAKQDGKELNEFYKHYAQLEKINSDNIPF